VTEEELEKDEEENEEEKEEDEEGNAKEFGMFEENMD
jgi:hypothetical protein